jgi:hypothetical protein
MQPALENASSAIDRHLFFWNGLSQGDGILMLELEICPGCAAQLPLLDGPTHRYIGASPACWALYSALNVGEPPIASGPYKGLLVDAYAAQHPGVPSPQAIQSVAVHLLTLYGILVKGMAPDQALWLRLRPLRDGKQPKHSRFVWLTPPLFAGSLTVADLVQAPTPGERAALVQRYVESVWATWAQEHLATIAQWYDRFVLADTI